MLEKLQISGNADLNKELLTNMFHSFETGILYSNQVKLKTTNET